MPRKLPRSLVPGGPILVDPAKEGSLTQIEGCVPLLLSSKSEEEWNNNCKKIKEANGNEYPEWWYNVVELVNLKGMMLKNGWVKPTGL